MKERKINLVSHQHIAQKSLIKTNFDELQNLWRPDRLFLTLVSYCTFVKGNLLTELLYPKICFTLEEETVGRKTLGRKNQKEIKKTHAISKSKLTGSQKMCVQRTESED